MNTAKLHTIIIRWGSWEPTEPFTYEFATEAELEAFLLGVDESSGWMDYTVVEEDELQPINKGGS